MMAITKFFKSCVPEKELSDYPLYFPSSSIKSPGVQTAHVRPTPKVDPPVLDAVTILFNKHSSGNIFVTAEVAALMAQELGYSPSLSDIRRLAEGCQNKIEIRNFETWVGEECASTTRQDNTCDLVKAFESFDTEKTGYLSLEQMKNILCEYGEGLTSREVDEVFKMFDLASHSQVNYRSFVEKLLS